MTCTLPAKREIELVGNIIRAVAEVWEVDPRDIIGRSRRQPLAFARQVAMAIAYEQSYLSLVKVGECFDNRDHGTVLHALSVVSQAIQKPKVAKVISEVLTRIKNTPES